MGRTQSTAAPRPQASEARDTWLDVDGLDDRERAILAAMARILVLSRSH